MASSEAYLLIEDNDVSVEGALRLARELAFAIGESASEHEALGTVLARVCRATNWQLGQAWTWNDDGLHCSPAWYCDTDIVPKVGTLRQLSLDLVLAPGISLPGLVWQTRQAAWDNHGDEYRYKQLRSRQLVHDAGLRACFAVPVAAGDEMVAVLEFFSVEAHPENPHLLRLISAIAVQLGSLLLRKRAEAALRESEAELQALMCAINDLVLVLDKEGRYLKVASTHNELLYQPASEILGKTLHEVLPGDLATQFMQVIERALHTHRTVEIEYSMQVGEEMLWFSAHISPMSDERVVWVARDITERKRAEVALAQAEKRYRSIFENAIEGIFQTDAQGRYLSANPALAHLYGYDSPAELMKELTDISHQLYLEPGRREEFVRLLARHERVSKFESPVRRKDGTAIWISENARTVRDENGTLMYYEGSVEDITERKYQQRQFEDQQTRLQEINVQLQVLATVDGLTGLKNHRALQDALRYECARAEREGHPLSVMLLDVDAFKPYNDTFGHPAGDDVLRQFAHILKTNARGTDFVARYGGEEFVAILPHTGRTAAYECAERFRNAIQNASWPMRAITASFGVATFDSATANEPITGNVVTNDVVTNDVVTNDVVTNDVVTNDVVTNDVVTNDVVTNDVVTNDETASNGTSVIDGEPYSNSRSASLLSQADKALYLSKTNGRNRTTHADNLN